ncbi:hypothetical protein [Marinoscillum sp.]|uniref:hypothetical protein n=1 Tax=Marinoscillum sp. TaxID=2024838 RepID=UPI003BAA539D
MKKLEIILGVVALISLALYLFLVPGSAMILLLSLTSLSIIYFYFSFALFNGVKGRNIFKKSSYVDLKTMRIVGSIPAGIALAITITGISFIIFQWPGARLNLQIGIIALSLVIIICAINYLRNKEAFYFSILKRTIAFDIIGLILLLLPQYALLEFRYRDFPEYVEAFKRASEDPTNQDLQEQLEQEQLKVDQEK